MKWGGCALEPGSAEPVPKEFKTDKKGDLKTKPDPVRRCTLENEREILRPFYMLKICK
jgi:hypothetical protein